MRTIRIGSGAGYSGDRIEPALAVMEWGNVHYMIFECLAERTIALAQLRRSRDSDQGYNELLLDRMRHVLPLCARKHIKVITNMGAANPRAALQVVRQLAIHLGLTSLKLAAVLRDDLFPQIDRYRSFPLMETGQPLEAVLPSLVSANAYLGVQGIVQALQDGADVILTGRVILLSSWHLCSLSLVGTCTSMCCSEKGRSRATCSNVVPRSPGDILLIQAIRTCQTWLTWVSR